MKTNYTNEEVNEELATRGFERLPDQPDAFVNLSNWQTEIIIADDYEGNTLIYKLVQDLSELDNNLGADTPKGRQEVVQVFTFDELDESAQEKAMEDAYYHNVDDQWFENIYEDAKESADLKITAFDIDRGNYCKGEFIYSAKDSAESIVKNHGEECETYKTAKVYLDDRKLALELYQDDEDENTVDDKLEELDEEFLKSLCEDYRIILRNEYEYMTSKEQIIETIRANAYEFTSNGKRWTGR